eukprot:425342_1
MIQLITNSINYNNVANSLHFNLQINVLIPTLKMNYCLTLRYPNGVDTNVILKKLTVVELSYKIPFYQIITKTHQIILQDVNGCHIANDNDLKTTFNIHKPLLLHVIAKQLNSIECRSTNINKSKIYNTKAKIISIDKAIACDVADAQLPGNAKKKHMTILFHPNKYFTIQDILIFEQFKTQWLHNKYLNTNANIPFTISIWGEHSVKIHGDLYDFCIDCRSKFNTNFQQRIPHIAIHSPEQATHPQNIDECVLYYTSCNVIKIGKCISIDVNDAKLLGSVQNKHMVLFWRSMAPFNDKEMYQVTQCVHTWIASKFQNNYNYKQQKQNNKNNNDLISFTIERWGKHSVKVKGDLYDLCLFVRDKLFALCLDEQRIPHIAIEEKQNERYNVLQITKRTYNNIHKNESKCNYIDENIKYYTKGVVCKVGKCVSIDVNDANLPGIVQYKHMVIFWRNYPFNVNEVNQISKCIQQWRFQEKQNSNLICFNIRKWGQCSVIVKGDLESLCLYVRDKLSKICINEQRVPHIALFEKQKHTKKNQNTGFR